MLPVKLKTLDGIGKLKFRYPVSEKKSKKISHQPRVESVIRGKRPFVLPKTLDIIPKFQASLAYFNKKTRYIVPVLVPKPLSLLEKILKRIKTRVLLIFRHLYSYSINAHLLISGLWRKIHKLKQLLIFAQLKALPRTPALVAIVGLMFVSAIAGGALVWSSKDSVAESPQVLGTSNINLEFVGPTFTDMSPLSKFANTSIQLIEKYIAKPATEQEFFERKLKLKEYLLYKRSPMALDEEALDTFVHASHMRIMLAITFAESTFGRNCVDNNCSNIGVQPGHRLWREYPTLSHWIVDFNRLLERRYKDWTLKRMCGVYVQPCNPGWMEATYQVIQELDERGI